MEIMAVGTAHLGHLKATTEAQTRGLIGGVYSADTVFRYVVSEFQMRLEFVTGTK